MLFFRLVGFSLLCTCLLAFGWLSSACEPAKVACIPGATVACACLQGPQGVQTCQANGTYNVCQCVSIPDTSTETSADAKAEPSQEAPTTEVTSDKISETPADRPLEIAQERLPDQPHPETPPEPSSSLEGLALFDKLAGLWIGAASKTPLGTFPIMMMDFRDASPHVLFARADLDGNNFLRFAFSIETHEGKDVLIYRNGGSFIGMPRDSRTTLVSYDAAKSTWRFCAIPQNCSYIDATFTFLDPQSLILDVKVRGKQHVYWQAERKETRTLPKPFPQDLTSQGPGTAPFPPMPSLRATVTWNPPLTQDGEVWLLLSAAPCGLTFSCNASRSIRVPVLAGATSADLLIEQLHKGPYYLNAVLDRNRDMAATRFPNSGDGIAFPLDVTTTIAPTGETKASLSIFYNVP